VSTNAKFVPEKIILLKFRGKIELLNTHKFFGQKFATVYQNSVRNFLCSSEKCKFLFHSFFILWLHCL